MAHKGMLTAEDFAEWHATVEQRPYPSNTTAWTSTSASTWTQGPPLFSSKLAILNTMDIGALGHNSADYLHTWVESAKLAFADREAYYGDPAFDEVPIDLLLSDDYAQKRAGANRRAIASRELRPGDLGGGSA